MPSDRFGEQGTVNLSAGSGEELVKLSRGEGLSDDPTLSNVSTDLFKDLEVRPKRGDILSL